MSRILSTGGGGGSQHALGGGCLQQAPGQTHPGQTPPRADTPCPVHTRIHTSPCPVHAGIHTSSCPVHAGIHPTGSGHCSGRYASYWDAFLFHFNVVCLFIVDWIKYHWNIFRVTRFFCIVGIRLKQGFIFSLMNCDKFNKNIFDLRTMLDLFSELYTSTVSQIPLQGT